MNTERDRLFDDLVSQEERLRGLLTEVRHSLEAGSDLTDKINVTLRTVEPLLQKVNANPNPSTTGIADYVEILDRGIVAIDRLDALLLHASPLLGPNGKPLNMTAFENTISLVHNETEGLLNAAFRLGACLIGIFLVGLLMIMVLFRIITSRISRPLNRSQNID